ncbi:MAG: ABC transporter ATP-binding protein [Planctomycetes bacterium]|nr:ABC transporter ATP-binding protein [Planctomycetota bacterium]
MISLLDAEKVYQTGEVPVAALAGVTLDVAPGEFIAIMGQSGSGKSTLLSVVGCLTGLTGGSYRFDGEDMSRAGRNRLAEVRNRKIGFVFQQFNLLPRLDALANVEVPLVYSGIAPAERRTRARAELEALGLGRRLGHFPNQLSGGEQQRVAIARALCGRPRVLLADEPTGNLDSKSGTEVMEIFDRLHAQGITLVMVTHDEEKARRADRIVRVRDGRVDRAVV